MGGLLARVPAQGVDETPRSQLPLAWWLAVAVLIVNDHVLKGSGLLPSALTGKLSDFAGLLVAPVLVARLFGVCTVRGRVAVLASVVVPFSVVNVWEAAAIWTCSLLGHLGLSCRLWTDPTDLIAVAVLPISWRWLTAPAPARTPSRDRAGLVLAALGCIATSMELPQKFDVLPPFIVNRTRLAAHIEVTVTADSCGMSDAEAAPSEPVIRRVRLEPAHGISMGELVSGAPCGRLTVVTGNARQGVRWNARIGGPIEVDRASWVDDASAVLAPFEAGEADGEIYDRAVIVVGVAAAPTLRVGTLLDPLDVAGDP